MENNMKVQLADITFDSCVDGPGLRTVVWLSGCSHRCSECHNERLQDFHYGYSMDVSELVDTLSSSKRITFSGGDPLFQVNALDEIIGSLDLETDIWIYTGFTLDKAKEILMDKPNLRESEFTIKCGRFDKSLKDPSCKFRGSSNQRIYHYINGIFTDISDKIDNRK